MTKKEQVTLVENVIKNQAEMNALTQDKVVETAPEVQELEPQRESLKSVAAREGARYIEPKKKLQAFGKLKDEFRKKHAYDWEYVKGIFDNETQIGQNIEFWHSKWPGDPDCMWSIPANVPVYVPRMIAILLSGEKEPDTNMQAMVYHKFDYRQKPEHLQRADDFAENFTVVSSHYQGKFRPVGAFQ